jgi:N-carbamoyl-L-amino-acid hydrolase
VAFTDEDLQGRQWVQSWMAEAGLEVRIDAAGNIIGSYAGTQPGLGAIATGSHIDTVPVGGRYDGVLGVLAGIEVVRTLKENGQRLNHAIEVIIFSDEENTVIGCKAMAGNVVSDPNYYRRNDGTPDPNLSGESWRRLGTDCHCQARSRGDRCLCGTAR